jgi:hypothetical protein
LSPAPIERPACEIVGVGSSSVYPLIFNGLNETVFAGLIQQSKRMTIARTGNGTRLRTIMTIKGDIAYLLCNRVSMSP